MAGYKQKIDKAAIDQLVSFSNYFPESWGTGDRTEMGYVYKFPEDGLEEIRIEYEAKKQLLGGVFSLVFKATCSDICLDSEEKTQMFYKGNFVKGNAYFRSGKKEDFLSPFLNQNAELMAVITEMDLLYLRVSCHANCLNIELSPLGGAYTYTVFPPMKYGGILPQQDLEKVSRILNMIAASFSTQNEDLAAGAES